MKIDNHQARKRFGQNFLHDQGVIQRIIQEISPKQTDNIVEIGPGKGALTEHLLKAVNHLHVIELDRDLARTLQERLNNPDNLTIHESDALKFDIQTLGATDLRIVGNLPYNISTPLLFHLLKYSSSIKDMIFMLQKEVVDRICADVDSNDYGRLSVMLQHRCTVKRMFTIKPGAFTPSPKIDSAIVLLKPQNANHTLKSEECFADIVKTAFSQRRKTIRNALKNKLTTTEIEQTDISADIRPQNVDIESFVRLSNAYFDKISNA